MILSGWHWMLCDTDLSGSFVPLPLYCFRTASISSFLLMRRQLHHWEPHCLALEEHMGQSGRMFECTIKNSSLATWSNMGLGKKSHVNYDGNIFPRIKKKMEKGGQGETRRTRETWQSDCSVWTQCGSWSKPINHEKAFMRPPAVSEQWVDIRGHPWILIKF